MIRLAVLLAFLLYPTLAPADDPGDPARITQQLNATLALHSATAALQAAVAAAQALPATPLPPVTVQSPAASTVVSVPSQIRDTLVSLAALLIPGLIGIGLKWMDAHLKVMREIGMNSAITTSAEGFGALLVQAVQKRGGALKELDVHSPEVATFANVLLTNYQQYVMALGMTPEKAATLILKGAAKLVAPAAAVTVVADVPAPAPPATDLTPPQQMVAPSWPAA